MNFKEFKVKELFVIKPTRHYRLTAEEILNAKGTTPVLSNSIINNGISGYSNYEPTESGNVITFSDTVGGSKAMFYQKESFIGFSHVQKLIPLNPNDWNENCYLYFLTALKKVTGTNWNFNRKLNRKLVEEFVIPLPVTKNNQLDFDHMEKEVEKIKTQLLEKIRKI